MTYFVVETNTGGQWENVWSTQDDSDSEPEQTLFHTLEDARDALEEFKADVEEASARGDLAETYDWDDYRIVEVRMNGQSDYDIVEVHE